MNEREFLPSSKHFCAAIDVVRYALCSELAGAYNWPHYQVYCFFYQILQMSTGVWHRMKHRRRRRSLLITIPCSLLLFGLVVTCSYISNRFSGNSTSDTFFLQDGERIFHYQQNNFVSKFCVAVLKTLNFASCKMLWHLYRKQKYSLELIADWPFG